MTQTIPESIAPNDEHAEQAALGCVLIDPSAIHTLKQHIQPDDFYQMRHRWIYETFVWLLEHGRSVSDVILITSHLEDIGRLDAVGGLFYISQLINVVPSALRVREYADRLSELGQRRRTLDLLPEIARRMYDSQQNVESTLTWTMDQIREGGRGAELNNAEDGARSVLEKSLYNKTHPLGQDEVRGQSLGMPGLDRATGGLFSGNVYYILAPTHVGKTWFLLNVLANIARTGKRVLLFSLEMSGDTSGDAARSTLWERLAQMEAGIDRASYLRGLTNHQFEQLETATDTISRWDFQIIDNVSEYAEIEAACHVEMRQRPCAAIGIDYLKLIGMSGERSASRNEAVGILTRKLKRLSDDLGTSLIVPHQVGDKSLAKRSDKKVQLSDGYESGHLSQDADFVFGLYRDELYNEDTETPNIMDVEVLKDRINGFTGNYTQLFFNKQTGRLSSAYTQRDGVVGD